MSRATRITVGAVVAGTLAFVALVAGIMSATAGVGGGFFDDISVESVDTYATAEVLDVDDEDPDWPTVDVRYTTEDGEVVVTYVDWEWSDDIPVVGDDVEVVYDSADPEWSFAADDPYVAGLVTDPPAAGDGTTPSAAGTGTQNRVAGWVSLAALLGLLVTVPVTVVAAIRAPTADAPGAPLVGPYGPTSFVGQPYPPQTRYPPETRYQPPTQYPPPTRAGHSVQDEPSAQAGRPSSGGDAGWSSP